MRETLRSIIKHIQPVILPLIITIIIGITFSLINGTPIPYSFNTIHYSLKSFMFVFNLPLILGYVFLRRKEYMFEAITGSENESILVDSLIDTLKEHVDSVKVIDTPVDSWREDECIIETRGSIIPCRAMPYISSAEIEAPIIDAFYVGSSIAVNQPINGRIVLVPFPPDPDDIKYVVLRLYEHGAVAAIFYDELPGRYRRMVLLGDEDYSHTHGSPSPIPAVSIRKEDYLKIKRLDITRLGLKVKSRVIHGSTGKTVIGYKNGSGDKEIHVTAHHDHWFTGFSDNMVGVELIIQASKKLVNWNGPNLVFISYTAEESGAPYYTSWYWAWGSRYYLNMLESLNRLENILADINIDAIYTKPFSINGNPALMDCVEKIKEEHGARYKGYDHTDFDSYSYTAKGIPALTIHNLDEMKYIYHTDLDDGREVGDHIISEALRVLVDTINCIARNPPRYNRLITYIRGNLPSHVEPEQAVLVGRLENLDKLVGNEQERIRIATKLVSTVSYIPGLDGLFYSDTFSDLRIIDEVMESIEKYLGKRIRVKVVDREQFLDVSPTRHNVEELMKALKYTLAQRLRMYNKQLDDYITEILIKNKAISRNISLGRKIVEDYRDGDTRKVQNG